MGVNITELIPRKTINVSSLRDKTIVVDTSLFLYQFISTIRQRDGSLLKDSKGNVTSHLSGLFNRCSNLMKQGIKLAFVFDGKPPELKKKEQERRNKLKEQAQEKYDLAAKEGDIASMKKYASRTVRLTGDMILEAKELISAFGLPIIQAPSEAEAQGSYMVKKGDCYAIATQDSDTLMFGAPRIIRNLSIYGKRKKSKVYAYSKVELEEISLSEVLNSLSFDSDQLIVLCMLIGTDYNIGGIKGIGPKNSVRLLKKHGKNFEDLFNEVKWSENFDYPWISVFNQIKNIEISDDYNLTWNRVNESKILKIMVEEHDFSKDRIQNTITDLKEKVEQKQQKTLSSFFN
jgi:flap endonuclease-1